MILTLMAKRMTIVIAAIVVVIVIALCLCNKDIKSEKINEKYTDYKYIWDITQTEKYEIELFYTSRGCDSPVYNKDRSSVIIDTKGSESENSKPLKVLYKLDRNGNIEDSLALYKYYRNISGNLVGKEDYISWQIDGDKTRKEFRIINKEPWFNERPPTEVLHDMYNQSQIVLDERDYFLKGDHWESLSTFCFFYEGQWCRLDIYNLEFDVYNIYSEKGKENVFQPLEWQEIQTYFDEGDYSKLRTGKVYLEYFDRKKLRKRRTFFTSYMPTGGFGSRPLWEGTGFVNIALNDDTLKVKMDMDEFLKFEGSYSYAAPSSYILYYTENMEIFILEHNNDLYLIKPNILTNKN